MPISIIINMPIKRLNFFFFSAGRSLQCKASESREETINTASYGGFKPVHKEVLGEVDRGVTGKLL